MPDAGAAADPFGTHTRCCCPPRLEAQGGGGGVLPLPFPPDLLAVGGGCAAGGVEVLPPRSEAFPPAFAEVEDASGLAGV